MSVMSCCGWGSERWRMGMRNVPMPAWPTIQDILMNSITPQMLSMQRTYTHTHTHTHASDSCTQLPQSIGWPNVQDNLTVSQSVNLSRQYKEGSRTRTPFTQPNLTAPPAACLAAKAVASSAAVGSSQLASPPSNGSFGQSQQRHGCMLTTGVRSLITAYCF